MGVVRNRVVVSQPEDGSAATTETTPPSEAGSAIEESEEESEELRRRLNQRNRARNSNVNKKNTFESKSSSSLNSHSGKRKIRRHANEKTLMIYLKEDEEEDKYRLMEPYKDPFARLMDLNLNSIELLNNFTSLLEEEEEGMNDFSVASCKNKILSPFQRISNKIRKAINMKMKKKNKNKFSFCLILIENIEENVLNFFRQNPEDIFCVVPSKSFERLMFHAVSQYHGLNSMSLVKNGHISVEIALNDVENNWLPVELTLTQFISKNF